VLPLPDGVSARRFPIVNVLLIAANLAFFAHVGGFIFGWIVARVLTGAGRIAPQARQPAPAAGS